MKYKVKLNSNLILGPYETEKISELIGEGRINENCLIQEFPIGEWELINLNEFLEVKNESVEINLKVDPSVEPDINSKFKEFEFEKKDIKFNVKTIDDNNSPTESLLKADNEVQTITKSTITTSDKTIVLKTKQFKNQDKTKVIAAHDIKNSINNVTVEEEKISEEVEPTDLLPEVSSEDKTIVFSKNNLELNKVLVEASETSNEYSNIIIEEQNSNKAEEDADKDNNKTNNAINDNVINVEDADNIKRKKIILIAVVGLLFYFFLNEEKKSDNGSIQPKYMEINFPVPDEIADDQKSQEFFRKGKISFLEFRKNYDYPNLITSISNFQNSIQKVFRRNKTISDNGEEKQITEINESIDYLILLNSFALEYVKNDTFSGESFNRLVSLVEQKKYTSVLIAEGLARYYLFYNKLNAAKGTVENYLRISKKPSIELFSLYLDILVKLGDFVKAKELVQKLEGVKGLPAQGFYSISKFYEFNEQPKLVFDILQSGIKEHPSNSLLLLAAIEFLLKERRINEVEPLLQKVKTLNANFSKILISRYYENLGLYYAATEDFKKAISSFKYALQIHKNFALQAKLSALEVGGSDVVENLILSSKSQILINQAKDFLKIGKLDQALRLAVEASDLSDLDINSKVFLSRVQLRKGLFNSAITMLEKYSKINNGNIELEAALVLAYIDSFKTDEAFKRLRVLSNSEFGASSEYNYLLGLLYEKEGDFYKASKSFEVSIQINPLEDKIFAKLGEIYLKARRYQFAKDRLNKAIQLNPNNAHYFALYSQVLYELNGPEMAIGYLRDQLNNFPNSTILNSKIAQYYYSSGLQKDYQRYRDMLLNYSEFEPSFYEFLINEARREGDTEKIVEYSKKYLEFDGSNLEIMFNLGKHYLNTKNGVEAEKIFNDLKDKLTTYPLVNYYLAKVYIELGNFDKAKEFGEVEKNLNPNKSNGDAVLGLIYKIKEEYPKAIKHYETAISLNSKDAEALLDLGWIRAKQLEFSRAKDLVTTAQNVEPDNPRVYKELGYIYKGLGQSALAIQYFETYLKMNALGNDKGIIESEINKLKF